MFFHRVFSSCFFIVFFHRVFPSCCPLCSFPLSSSSRFRHRANYRIGSQSTAERHGFASLPGVIGGSQPGLSPSPNGPTPERCRSRWPCGHVEEKSSRRPRGRLELFDWPFRRRSRGVSHGCPDQWLPHSNMFPGVQPGNVPCAFRRVLRVSSPQRSCRPRRALRMGCSARRRRNSGDFGFQPPGLPSTGLR